jgi:hypothetical protein
MKVVSVTYYRLSAQGARTGPVRAQHWRVAGIHAHLEESAIQKSIFGMKRRGLTKQWP